MATNLTDDEGKILHDNGGDILFATGTSAPSDASSGYAVGCIFQATSGAVGEVLFTNVGTTSSCNFDVVQAAGGALTVRTTRVAANYTVLSTDCHINVNSTAELRFSANPTTGQIWIVSTNSLALQASISFEDVAGKVNGINTLTLTGNETVSLISDGSNLHSFPAQAELNAKT